MPAPEKQPQRQGHHSLYEGRETRGVQMHSVEARGFLITGTKQKNTKKTIYVFLITVQTRI